MLLKKVKPWTVALLSLIIADSVFTSFLVNNGIATESNPLINWFMVTFSLDIDAAMVFRIICLLPCLAFVNTTNYSKHVTISYIGIYFIGIHIN
jgi:hypothetical protein